jgi:hypothetical protein
VTFEGSQATQLLPDAATAGERKATWHVRIGEAARWVKIKVSAGWVRDPMIRVVPVRTW